MLENNDQSSTPVIENNKAAPNANSASDPPQNMS